MTLKSRSGPLKVIEMVPFDRLGTIYLFDFRSTYDPAVSLAVCEIYIIKELRDLEYLVRGCSRSLKWRRSIDHNTFYWSAVVSVAALSCTSSLTLNNIVTLTSGLEVTQGY